ncbi:MAG: hypothetical protein ACW967_10615 [Candidatus Hodarchaeales archaeon]
MFLTGISQAHVPVKSENNSSLDSAEFISNPSKSWAIYSELQTDEKTHYYTFNIEKEETIYISLFTAIRPENENFLPSFALMGASILENDTLPENIEIPQNVGILNIESNKPQSGVYEAFGPSNFYNLAELRLAAPNTGQYYIVVYENNNPGFYGLAIGLQESFSIEEIIFNPINVINVYLWQGEDLLLILSPIIFTIIIGLFVIFRFYSIKDPKLVNSFSFWIGSLVTVLFLSSTISMSFQMLYSIYKTSIGPEILITGIFIFIPLIFAILTLRLTIAYSKNPKMSQRVAFLLMTPIALFFWAGYILGPLILVFLAILPKLLIKKSLSKRLIY